MMSSSSKNRRRGVLLLYAIVSFLFFYFLIPLSVYNFSPFTISLAGSSIVGVLIAIMFHTFNFMHDGRFDLPVIPIVVYLLLILGSGLLVFFFMEHFQFRKAEELDKNGVATVAEVVDHERFSLKKNRATRYFVMIKYRVGDWVHWVEEEVNPDILFRCRFGEKVKIRYSKNHPRIVQITSCY